MTSIEIQRAITDYIGKTGYTQAKDWYIGIATDPKERLFNDHNVSEQNGKWGYYPADSEQTTRNAESSLLEKYPSFQGGTGDGTSPSYVYTYYVTADTVE